LRGGRGPKQRPPTTLAPPPFCPGATSRAVPGRPPGRPRLCCHKTRAPPFKSAMLSPPHSTSPGAKPEKFRPPPLNSEGQGRADVLGARCFCPGPKLVVRNSFICNEIVFACSVRRSKVVSFGPRPSRRLVAFLPVVASGAARSRIPPPPPGPTARAVPRPTSTAGLCFAASVPRVPPEKAESASCVREGLPASPDSRLPAVPQNTTAHEKFSTSPLRFVPRPPIHPAAGGSLVASRTAAMPLGRPSPPRHGVCRRFFRPRVPRARAEPRNHASSCCSPHTPGTLWPEIGRSSTPLPVTASCGPRKAVSPRTPQRPRLWFRNKPPPGPLPPRGGAGQKGVYFFPNSEPRLPPLLSAAWVGPPNELLVKVLAGPQTCFSAPRLRAIDPSTAAPPPAGLKCGGSSDHLAGARPPPFYQPAGLRAGPFSRSRRNLRLTPKTRQTQIACYKQPRGPPGILPSPFFPRDPARGGPLPLKAGQPSARGGRPRHGVFFRTAPDPTKGNSPPACCFFSLVSNPIL